MYLSFYTNSMQKKIHVPTLCESRHEDHTMIC